MCYFSNRMAITYKLRPKREPHPNSLKNLRPFQPGNCANPKGRPPKDVSLTSLAKVLLGQIPEGATDGKTWRQRLVEAWLRDAENKPQLLEELLERVEGRVPQRQEITGADGGPVQVSNEALVAKLEAIAQSVQHAKPGGTED